MGQVHKYSDFMKLKDADISNLLPNLNLGTRFMYIFSIFKKSVAGQNQIQIDAPDPKCYADPEETQSALQADKSTENDSEADIEPDVISCISQIEKFRNYQSFYTESMIS